MHMKWQHFFYLTTSRGVAWWHCNYKKYTSCTFVSYLYCCLFIGYIYPLAPRLCLNVFFWKKIQHILLFSKSLGSKILIHCLLSKNANIYCYYMSIFIMSVFGVAWRAGGSECNVKQKWYLSIYILSAQSMIPLFEMLMK